jgi:large repetitive protein
MATALAAVLARAAGEDADSYAISQGTLSLGDNYTISFTGSTLTIASRAISIAASSQHKTYGEDDPQLNYAITAGSLVDGDSFSGSLARTAGEDVDSYAISQGTLSLGDNYTINFTGSTLTITPRAISVAADSRSKTYGHADPILSCKITAGSLVDGDIFSGRPGQNSRRGCGQLCHRPGHIEPGRQLYDQFHRQYADHNPESDFR